MKISLPTESSIVMIPGVAAVSYHPLENKVIFIHGPMLEDVKERGPYSIRNRTALLVDGEGKFNSFRIDLRDISSETTIAGAHRGVTTRMSTAGTENVLVFMQPDRNAPEDYSHYFK